MSRSVETTSSGGSAQSGSGGSADAVTATTGLRKIVAASMAGTVVEWYEFFLYATAASLVFGTFFFPNAGTRLDGIIAAFLMGCLPGYNTIGYWAPALLVALRFIQGFAVGGEWGGAVLLVAEHSPDKSRGFWSSWPQAAVPVGKLLATLALLTMSWILPNDQFLSWGWRLAFWLSAVIVVIGYYIRSHVNEAPIFLGARAQVEAEKAVSHGVTEVVKKYPRRVLPAMGLRFAENTLCYIIVSFSIVYLLTITSTTPASCCSHY